MIEEVASQVFLHSRPAYGNMCFIVNYLQWPSSVFKKQSEGLQELLLFPIPPILEGLPEDSQRNTWYSSSRDCVYPGAGS